MARIAGVTLPKEKRIEIALTYIFGIGRSQSQNILEQAKINFDKKVQDLSENEEQKLRTIIADEYTTEGDLRREIQGNIERLKRIGSYRGLRHRRGLPVRGQRTKTNARTKRGKKVTMGSGRKIKAK